MSKYVTSIVTSNLKRCYMCGSGATDVHHVFGAANRKNSTKYGLVVGLCRACHNLEPYGVHQNRQRADWLKAQGQKAFEEKYGHEEFMRIFGKNYL